MVGFGEDLGVVGVAVGEGVGLCVFEGSGQGGCVVWVWGVGSVGVELEFVLAEVEGFAGEVGEFDGFVVHVAFDVFGDEEVGGAGDGGVCVYGWCGYEGGEDAGCEEDRREGEGHFVVFGHVRVAPVFFVVLLFFFCSFVLLVFSCSLLLLFVFSSAKSVA